MKTVKSHVSSELVSNLDNILKCMSKKGKKKSKKVPFVFQCNFQTVPDEEESSEIEEDTSSNNSGTSSDSVDDRIMLPVNFSRVRRSTLNTKNSDTFAEIQKAVNNKHHDDTSSLSPFKPSSKKKRS
jgi:hypothetical protein